MPFRPQIDLDRPVRDRLVLRTVPGAVDYLVEDLRALPATILRREPDRLLVEYTGALRPLAASRYFDICAVEDTDPVEGGALAALQPDGPVRFRVGTGVPDRWKVRDQLAERYGWVNDPRSWDVNVEPHGAELGALYLTQVVTDTHGEKTSEELGAAFDSAQDLCGLATYAADRFAGRPPLGEHLCQAALGLPEPAGQPVRHRPVPVHEGAHQPVALAQLGQRLPVVVGGEGGITAQPRE